MARKALVFNAGVTAMLARKDLEYCFARMLYLTADQETVIRSTRRSRKILASVMRRAEACPK
jgi:hypothetical protein